MIKPSYRAGVEFIALNDEPEDLDAGSVEGYVSTIAIATAFRVDPLIVALAVVRYRRKAIKEGLL